MTKVFVKDICRLLEDIAPVNLQEPYDNASLILGHEEQEVTGILICLDSLESVVDEAIELGCNLIVAHHPIIFGGLKKINGNHYVEKIVIKAIQNNIAIYAAHTNLDNVLKNGVNQKIADKLGLENTSILVEKLPNIGAGLLGTFRSAISMDLFLQNVKNKFVRHDEMATLECKYSKAIWPDPVSAKTNLRLRRLRRSQNCSN